MNRKSLAVALTTVVLTVLAVRPLPVLGQSAPTFGGLVVSAVEERYLYQRSPAWEPVRREILAVQNEDPAAAYAGISRALSKLQDSELRLISPPQLEALNEQSKGTKTGAGLIDFAVDLDPATGEARVVTPLVGSPAARSGIRPRDVIVAINGERTSTMTLPQVLDALRQWPVTAVRLRVRRDERIRDVRIEASPATFVPVASALQPARTGAVAYVRVALITPDCGDEVKRVVARFEERHDAAYVLDLRNNPGGFLNAAVAIAGLFTSGELGTKVLKDGEKEAISSQEPVLTQKPVVVLINEGTASAAELLAAALQGRHRAVLVGAPSYGRGQAQSYVPLAAGYGLMVPSALLQAPAGRGFKRKGLDPDVSVAQDMLPEAALGTKKDRQYQAALSTLRDGK